MFDAIRPRLPWLLLVALGLACLLVVGYAAATTTIAFGPYTTSWEGTSDLRSMADDDERELIIGDNGSVYDDVEANGTLAVVLSPAEPYDRSDREAVAQFVERGGTLIVAEAYGPHGNDLLDWLNTTSRVHGDPLRDETNYDVTPAFPETGPATPHPYVNDTDTVVFNHGTALETDPDETTVLLTSSPFSYLDHDRDGQLGDGDELAVHPVATVEAIGDGHVLVIGDPSVFINVMLDRGDNRVLLAAILDDHERVLVDVSHAGDLPPLAIVLLAIRDSIALQAAILAIGIATVWTAFRTPMVAHVVTRVRGTSEDVQPAELDHHHIRRHLEERHPDWDPDRIERIAASIGDDQHAKRTVTSPGTRAYGQTTDHHDNDRST